jgi:LAO/AO transport system kinase
MSAQPDHTARRALAQSISVVERGGAPADALIASALEHLRQAPPDAQPLVIGITGAPGVGKSSLVSALSDQARTQELRVAVLAVDPSSAATGGALLGDRVRIDERPDDAGRFVRSLATRGSGRALARAAAAASLLLEAAGFSLVFVETVGAGQADLGIARLADLVVLVEGPEGGDEVQAMKAGLLEAADLVVVNKGDRPGADAAAERLRSGLALGATPVPVLVTSALDARGVPELLQQIIAMGASRTADGRIRRIAAHLVARAEGRLAERIATADGDGTLTTLARSVSEGETPLTGAAETLLGGGRSA